MPDPSAPDFFTDLRRAANAPVSPAFIENVLHRSQRRRRLRLISAFAAPALSAAVLVPLAINLTQHHRPSQDHLGTTASGPRSVADANTGFMGSPEPSATPPSTAAPNPLGPTCEPGQLLGSRARGVSPQLGESSLFINLVNVSKASCSVSGYPDVRFFAGGTVMPFPVAHTGNYLLFENAEPARQQQVLPGGTVHILIARYRCDVGTDQVSDSVKVQLADGTDLDVFPRNANMPYVASCRPQDGTTAEADPGNFLQVSAFIAGQGGGD